MLSWSFYMLFCSSPNFGDYQRTHPELWTTGQFLQNYEWDELKYPSTLGAMLYNTQWHRHTWGYASPHPKFQGLWIPTPCKPNTLSRTTSFQLLTSSCSGVHGSPTNRQVSNYIDYAIDQGKYWMRLQFLK